MKQKFSVLTSLKRWASVLKSDIFVLYLALKYPLTPWYAKVAAAIVVGYALSPIDFIPDFIPILGYLDDVLLLPLGIAITIRLIPPAILASCREQVRKHRKALLPKLWIAAGVIIFLWLLLCLAAYRWLATLAEC